MNADINNNTGRSSFLDHRKNSLLHLRLLLLLLFTRAGRGKAKGQLGTAPPPPRAITQYPKSARLLWARVIINIWLVSSLHLMLIAWIKNAITVQCSHIVLYVFCLCLVNLSMEKGLLMVVRGEANFEIHRPWTILRLIPPFYQTRQGAVGDLPPPPRFHYQHHPLRATRHIIFGCLLSLRRGEPPLYAPSFSLPSPPITISPSGPA